MKVWKCAYMKPGGGIEILEWVFNNRRSNVEPERGEQTMNIGGWVSQSNAMKFFIPVALLSFLGKLPRDVTKPLAQQYFLSCGYYWIQEIMNN